MPSLSFASGDSLEIRKVDQALEIRHLHIESGYSAGHLYRRY
jgi:hypothetical protein